MAHLRKIDIEENTRRMRSGELYYAFTPDLIADRKRCSIALDAFNKAGSDVTRREQIELLKKYHSFHHIPLNIFLRARERIQDDKTPLPAPALTPEEDEDLLSNYVWCIGPIRMDYGRNVKFGDNVFVNANSTWVDTCLITVGSRTLIGPNCSFYSGSHPLDPAIRNGINGPEGGAPITIGDDCWFGGNAIVLPGVTIGRGATIGAGSVVTKDVPPFSVVVGNPARVIRKIESQWNESVSA